MSLAGQVSGITRDDDGRPRIQLIPRNQKTGGFFSTGTGNVRRRFIRMQVQRRVIVIMHTSITNNTLSPDRRISLPHALQVGGSLPREISVTKFWRTNFRDYKSLQHRPNNFFY